MIGGELVTGPGYPGYSPLIGAAGPGTLQVPQAVLGARAARARAGGHRGGGQGPGQQEEHLLTERGTECHYF